MGKKQLQTGFVILLLVVLAVVTGNTKIDYAPESHEDWQQEPESDGEPVRVKDEDEFYGRLCGLDGSVTVRRQPLGEETCYPLIGPDFLRHWFWKPVS